MPNRMPTYLILQPITSVHQPSSLSFPKVRDEDRAKPYRASIPLNNIARSEKDTSCQCSEIVLVKRDAQSQYIRDLTDAICCCCLSYEYRPMCRASSQVGII